MRLFAIGALVVLLAGNSLAQETLKILDNSGDKTVGDPVAYAFGYQFGLNLAQGGVNGNDLKPEDIIKGLKDALNGQKPSVSNETVETAMKAFDEKMQARAQEKAKAKLAENAAYLEENKKKEGVQVTNTGLQYKVLKAGTGESPKLTSTVTVNYEGKLTNGQVFDSSIARGQPATFPVNRVIPGWTEALQRMKVGDKWQLFIPSNLAYGENGSQSIGPNEVLVFEVELLEVK